MLFLFDVPHKKLNEHQSIVTSPYQNLNSVPQNHVSEAVCPFAAGTSCLKTRVEELKKNEYLGASISFYHMCIVLTVL